jgi:hypothetical protein
MFLHNIGKLPIFGASCELEIVAFTGTTKSLIDSFLKGGIGCFVHDERIVSANKFCGEQPKGGCINKIFLF